MKKIISLSIFILFAVVVSLYAFSNNANSKNVNVEVNSGVNQDSSITESKLIAYYFYTTARCVSCHKIEQYTKEALDKFFSDETASGKLGFQMINIDEPQNKHYIQDYQLYTKSVVLSKVFDGKEIKFKNLEKVWSLLGDKEKFYRYIQDETNNFIN